MSSERIFKAPSSSEEGVGGGEGPTRATMLERAATMRREPTEPEKRLWIALRDSSLDGFKFRRQATIGDRIVDFLFPAKGLVVEVDGETHDRAMDVPRDEAMLRDRGFMPLRFTNEDVMRNLEGVLLVLRETLDARPDRWPGTTPQPPPLKRRGS